MSQANSSSCNEVVIATQKLSVPIGTQLADPNNRTLIPSSGSIAYDTAAELLYFGTTDQWVVSGATGAPGQTGPTGLGATGPTGLGATGPTGLGATGPTGQPGLTSVGPISLVGTANGASIASQTLTLHSATTGSPGITNTTTQSFSGVKSFTSGARIFAFTPSDPIIETFLDFYGYVNYFGANVGTWSGAFNLAQNLLVVKLGPVAFLMPGNVINNGSANSVLTYSKILPAEFRPGTVDRGGIIPVWDNGVQKAGYFNVSMGGVITVGLGDAIPAGSGNLVPFIATGATSGIPDCCVCYSLA